MNMKWDGNRYHNEFGCIAGRIQEKEFGWSAFCPSHEWIGDYISGYLAMKAVEHSYKDPKGMPYPI